MTETATTIGYKKSLVTFRLTPNEAIIKMCIRDRYVYFIGKVSGVISPMKYTYFFYQ